MLLDIRTTIMIAAWLALVVALCLNYVLRDYPQPLWPSIRLWILGMTLQPTAWILYGLRDQIPDWLTVVVANTLLSFSYANQVKALRLFVGRPADPRWLYAPVALIALVEILFNYVWPSIRGRLVIASALYCVQMLDAVAVLLDRSQPRRRSHVLTATAFAVVAAVIILRILYEGLKIDVLTHALAATPMQNLIFCCAAFFPIVATLGFVLMCTDRLHQELERHAALDSLTGISNRRTLDAQATRALALALRHVRPLAVLLIDVDHFKRINDEYGHATGDEVLQKLATTMKTGLRAEDLFGRLGGEEFVAVLPESDEAAARNSAERLRRAVEEIAFSEHGERLALRVSIGIAALRPGDQFAALLRRADLAMYAAKRAGRNCVRGPDEPDRDSETPVATH